MNLKPWMKRLLKLPGARHVKAHLLDQGHTEQEADIGGLAVAALAVFLAVLFFDGFLYGVIRTFFGSLWEYFLQNGLQAAGVGIFGTLFFLALLFKYTGERGVRKAQMEHKSLMDRHRIEEKKAYLSKGAMGNLEEIFRFYLRDKYPEIEVKSVHAVDTTPRIRFQARRFSTEFGGQVEKNYQLFRDALFADTLRVMETAFSLSDNIPAVVVDAAMNFISGKAKYYEGLVLSVKAQRNVFEQVGRGSQPPFRILSAFDLRYRDGMEVQPLPSEESKSSRLIEHLKEKAPKLNIRYESVKKKVDEGWEKPPETGEPLAIQETFRGKELSSLSLAAFEELVLGVLGKMSFEVLGVKKVPGGTLQIQADFHHPVVGGRFLVLARQYPETAPVHADLVRELDVLAREESCKRGVYIVTGRFTDEAKNISRNMAVDLVDGVRLDGLIQGPAYDGRWTFRIVDEKGVVTELGRMSLMDFEKETDLFLKSMGFRMEKIRRVPGGAVTAVAEFPHPVVGGKFAVVSRQCQPGERVTAELVSETSHIMKSEFCFRGLLMVPADFSREALALARFSNVETVDLNQWENLRRRI
jgi:Restriction endonuclease